LSQWSTLPPAVRRAIQEECTPEESQALQLYAGGMGYRRIGSALGITRDTARNRVERALGKVRRRLGEDA